MKKILLGLMVLFAVLLIISFSMSFVFAQTLGNETGMSKKDIANKTIEKIKKSLIDIKGNASLFPSWYNIGGLIGLEEINDGITEIEQEYAQASSDEEYSLIIANLDEIRVPYAVRISKIANLSFFDDVDQINLENIKEIGGGDYNENEDYKKAIVSWFSKNVQGSFSYKLISFYYDDGIENKLSVFNFRFIPKENAEGEAFFIVEKNKEEMLFEDETGLIEIEGAIGIPFEISSEKEFSFAIKEKVDFFEIPMYLSPSLDEIKIAASPTTTEKGFNYEKFWLGFFIVLIAAFIIYNILQQWYKKNYERYLFKNRGELYNLLNFSYNARKQGLTESEIRKRLKKVGWDSEKISYAVKKAQGKKVGMWEFPFFKWLEKRKVEQEMAKKRAQERAFGI